MANRVFQLVYLSVASHPLSKETLTKLLVQSRRDNLAMDVTGLLLYANGHFMQLLEGDREKIEALVVRIQKDNRHRKVNVLEKRFVTHRQFPDWSMAFLDFADPQIKSLPGYSPFLEDPFQLKDATGATKDTMNLLNYFKAVITASDANLLTLAENVSRHKTDRIDGEASR